MNKYDINFQGFSKSTIDPCFIIIHHTAGPKDQSIESIKSFHVSKGWGDIAYHWLIQADGKIIKGRPENKIGTHAPGYGMNFRSIGVCVVGNYEEYKPTDAQINGLKKIVREICMRYKIPLSNVLGHKAIDQTLCPGKYLYARLDDVRAIDDTNEFQQVSAAQHSFIQPLKTENDQFVDQSLVEYGTSTANTFPVLPEMTDQLTTRNEVLQYGKEISQHLPSGDKIPAGVEDQILKHDGKATLERVKKYYPVIQKYALANDVDPMVALTIAYQESRVEPKVTNEGSGAYGMFQVKPATAKEMKVDMTTVDGEILAGIKYIHWITQSYGLDKRDWTGIYGRYAAGPKGFENLNKDPENPWWKTVLGEAVKLVVEIFIDSGGDLN